MDSQAAVDDLMDAFDGFHDACFREASITAETYVDERSGMHCPGHLDTSVVMFFQSQGARYPAIEVACSGVSQFRVSPTPDNCDSILGGAAFSREGPFCRLGFSFVGGPLTGPPNGSLEIVSNHPIEAPDVEVIALAMSWRPIEDAAGQRLRYRSDSLTEGA